LGQDTTSYGEDLGLKDGLPLLLDRLSEIEGLQWCAFCMSIRIASRSNYLRPSPHARALQNISTCHCNTPAATFLARMKRGGSGDAFLKLLERMRRTIPGVALRTSFIVGFPGETYADFKELCDFVRAAKFDWMACSAIPSRTAASHALDARDKVEPAVITERRDQLMAIQKKISARNFAPLRWPARDGASRRPVERKRSCVEARLENHAPEIDGKLLLTDIETPSGTARPGDIITAEIDPHTITISLARSRNYR